jgi:hypothetical protein
MYFTGQSKTWGGAVCVLDPDEEYATTLGRAYLITAEQFSDIAAQEMGRAVGTDLPIADLLDAGTLELGPGRYETLTHLGDLYGYPMLTFTASWSRRDVLSGTPSAGYLRTIAAGLLETYDFPPERAADYLHACMPSTFSWSRSALVDLATKARNDALTARQANQ